MNTLSKNQIRFGLIKAILVPPTNGIVGRNDKLKMELTSTQRPQCAEILNIYMRCRWYEKSACVRTK